MNSKYINEMKVGIDVLKTLLLDRTTKKNIIWANNNYYIFDSNEFAPDKEIKISHVINHFGSIIIPRAYKTDLIKHDRKKENAEVFTPKWIVKLQNDMVENQFSSSDFETSNYVNKIWLEITCGEGPYITTRYDLETGEHISVDKREGFLDRKLKKIINVNDKNKWLELAFKAYQSTYGFEWNGDSLFIARLNLLNTFKENYIYKWEELPCEEDIKEIANIISFNIFQMDGINSIIPLSDSKKFTLGEQISLFDNSRIKQTTIKNQGIKVRIKDWNTGEHKTFEEVKYEKDI